MEPIFKAGLSRTESPEPEWAQLLERRFFSVIMASSAENTVVPHSDTP